MRSLFISAGKIILLIIGGYIGILLLQNIKEIRHQDTYTVPSKFSFDDVSTLSNITHTEAEGGSNVDEKHTNGVIQEVDKLSELDNTLQYDWKYDSDEMQRSEEETEDDNKFIIDMEDKTETRRYLHEKKYTQQKPAKASGKTVNIKGLLGCRKLPDILIIGFEKCGTVTLKSFLGIHPKIFVPNLLTNLKVFDKGRKTTAAAIKQYMKNQKCTPQGKLRLEKLSTRGLAKKTFALVPNIKLIAIVKEPVERSMSHYVHRVAKGIEKKGYTFDSMIRSIMDHDKPIPMQSSVLFRQSKYIDRLEPWISTYGMDKIHVVDGDSFVKHPADELRKVEKFLGLASFISENHFVYNPVKRFFCLKQFGTQSCMSSNKGRPHPTMSKETRKRLQVYYRPYNEKLFTTIGRKLPWNY